jgi:methionyl-tRNA formyltransferase
MKIVFLGSADFGLPALNALYESGHTIAAVVSTPARKKGRGLKLTDSPIATCALENKITPIFTPTSLKSEEFIEDLKKLEADLFVVVAFRILPVSVFSLPRLGTINIHASLLPKFRGPAPIQRAIAAGEKESGITIFRINEGIDTGNIILQKKTDIGDDETTEQLYSRLSEMGACSLSEAITLLENETVNYIKQDESLATPAPKLTKDEGRVDWGLSAQTLFNRIRAFKPFPGAYTFFEGHRVTIERASVIDKGNNDASGTIRLAPEGFDVQCGNGALRVLEVKPEGKASMSAKAFTLGRKIPFGAKFT